MSKFIWRTSSSKTASPGSGQGADIRCGYLSPVSQGLQKGKESGQTILFPKEVEIIIISKLTGMESKMMEITIQKLVVQFWTIASLFTSFCLICKLFYFVFYFMNPCIIYIAYTFDRLSSWKQLCRNNVKVS